MVDSAVVIRAVGGPEVLKHESIAVGNPGKGQVRIKQTVIGVNFHDCYVRSGLTSALT